jgi:anti-sigma factor RsiW
MITEDFEFLISQYADGTIADEQREAVRVRIEADPVATALLAEFRRIDQLMGDSSPIPMIDYGRLQSNISSAIDNSRPAVAGRIGQAFQSWKLWTSVAAVLLIAVGIGSTMMHRSPTVAVNPTVVPTNTRSNPSQTQTPGEMLVIGPAVEAPAGRGVEEIKIGPSPALASRGAAGQYADDLMTRPSSVKIADRGAPGPKPH